jgi:methyl-accepting chemotaxis protein
MLQKLRTWIFDRLQIRASLYVVGMMLASLAIFGFYDVREQRNVLKEALLQKGKSMALSGSEAIGHVLEDAIASGRLTEAQVFDDNYQPIPDTDPQKYHTAYDSFTDANILEIEDAYLSDQDVAYVKAVDVNGYLPTHNTRYSKPLTGNYATDLEGNRTKRIFSDPVGIRAARNTEEPALRQVYHRDTGEVLWDISAPVWVNGRHWGAVRVGFLLERVQAQTTAVLWRIARSALLLIFVLGVSVFLVIRSIVKPILALRGVATALAESDLTQKVGRGFRYQDEMSELATALNAASATWREIISGLCEDALRLSTTAAELASSSEELSRTTATQSDGISRTSTAVEEMAASIREVARNAELAAQAATVSDERAQVGGELAANTTVGLERADEIMQRLRARSGEIGTIVNLIQEIAAQTNILALNAAIEAAGAGVAGARFDVVAEEIRKLAGRTSQATGEIAQLIGALQADTQAAAEAISEGAAMAKESGASLADIVGTSTAVNAMVQNISSAAEQQSKTSSEIANSLDAIVDGSRHTATATREMAQIGIQLSNLAERLKEAAGQFKV